MTSPKESPENPEGSENSGNLENLFPVTGSIPVVRGSDESVPDSAPVGASAGPRGGLWFFIVIAGGVFAAMTAPGQTAGLSPFTDPLIDTLGVDRTSLSLSYLVATLAGAVAMPFVGRMVDRFGAKIAIGWITVAFAAVLVGVSFVTNIFGLTAGYVGLRMFGQGALTLAATTLVARLITHRSGLALGIAGAIGAGGISLAPVGVERLIAWSDIATAWRIEAVIVAVIVLPLVLVLPRDRPRTHTDTGTLIVAPPETGHTARFALGTVMFWVFTGAGFAVGMMSTGMAFHLISLLGQQGLSTVQAASNFIPQTVAALLGTLALGAFVDRTDPRIGVVLSMLTLAGSMVVLPFVGPGVTAVMFGVLLGLAQGALRGVEAAGFVRYFGRAHIGSIRGIATGVGLASTALGPLYYAIGLQMGGSYLPVSIWGATLPLGVIVVALIAKPPMAFEGTQTLTSSQ
jgi:MFS family permease